MIKSEQKATGYWFVVVDTAYKLINRQINRNVFLREGTWGGRLNQEFGHRGKHKGVKNVCSVTYMFDWNITFRLL